MVKSKQQKTKINSISSKFKTALKDTIKKVKTACKNGRKFLQTMYLLKDLYLQYIKNSSNSLTKRQFN